MSARGVAIVGMACRLPGAETPAAFWSNLCRGVESITFFTDDELLAQGVEPALLRDPHYVKAAPVLGDVERFDAALFEYSPREAALMDPQQRLFLEVAWETFEDAGYHAASYDGVVGVFAGAGGVVTSYLVAHRGHPAFPGQTAGLPHIGNDKDFLATRVSYKLDLTGPSVTVQTACSTSLVAVHLACQSVLSGECDMVLAGAATVRIPHRVGYLAERGNVHSLDGHCRAFDAEGQGTIFGSGVVAVLLKDVNAAISAGDHIYAVIKGTAVTNDGGRKVSYTAPSVTGQARAMVEALTVAEVTPDSVRYVECHATGTTVGDPLEIEALTRAFRTQTDRVGFCAVGSVKTNVGHPEQAAGLAALVKTALALKYGRIPPSLHFAMPNPTIDFASSPFYVATALTDWPRGEGPRRAAVNSLGIGGTNAFAVLEEPPAAAERAVGVPPTGERARHVFTLSAKSDAALRAYAQRMHVALESGPALDLADVCFTSNVSRSALPHRFAVATDNVAELPAKLRMFVTLTSKAAPATGRGARRPLVFLFTGQGAQYAGMARQLYRTQPPFRRALDECAESLGPHLERPLLEVLFGEATALLDETAYTQPALFAVEWALARLWCAWGVVPDAVMGHSIGEITAACVAGALDRDDALRLVAARGRLMQSLPKRGAMAVVFAAEAVVREALAEGDGQVAIAAVNGPQSTVVSGERAAVGRIVEALKAAGVPAKALTVSHAFHSPLMDPILDRFERMARTIDYRAPSIPLVSNLTGDVVKAAPDGGYWREHLRQAVRFADGLATLHGLGHELFLEVGPGAGLVAAGRQCLPPAKTTWLSSLTGPEHERDSMLASLQMLYLEGFPICWPAVHEGQERRRVSLPTYPFQRKRYWLDGAPLAAGPARAAEAARPHPLLGGRTLVEGGETRFVAACGLAELPYLSDHRVHGLPVLPTATALEAALAAGREHFGSADVTVGDVTYHEVLVVPEEGARELRLMLTGPALGRAAFRLQSRQVDEDAWRTHVTGVLAEERAARPGAMSLDEAHARCPRETDGARYYADLRRRGLGYGESFRCVQRLRRGAGEVLAWVALPTGVPRDGYALHPALLDACLHVYPSLVERGAGAPAYLPVGVEQFAIHRAPVTEAWVHAVRRAGAGDAGTPVVDIEVYDREASPVASLRGLSLRRLAPEALRAAGARPFTRWLYQMRWDEDRRPAPPRGSAEAPASWIIFADRGGLGTALAASLERRGDRCHVVVAGSRRCAGTRRHGVDPARPEHFRALLRDIAAGETLPCRGAVYLWGLDAPRMAGLTLSRLERAEAHATGGALFLAQALAEGRTDGGFAPRLWLVTRSAQEVTAHGPAAEATQAPLWGLGRTLALEHPPLWGGLVDLGPARRRPARSEAAALVSELGRAAGEDQVALRDGQRFVARLARLPREAAPAPSPAICADATYLVTGGLGTLGLRIARWLVEQGARALVLTGRGGARGEAVGAVEALRALGAKVRVVKADVSVEADVRRLIGGLRNRRAPLKGVIHCAGVLDDGVLGQMDWAKFTRATAPKIKGSWLLHRYTEDLDLDLFVLQSSMLSLIGSAGQVNYTAGNAFVDALATHRRARGLPVTSINWGPWAEAGMAAASGSRGELMWRSRGMSYIAAEDGMRVFADLLGRGASHAAVTITDWPAFLRRFPSPPPFYEKLAAETGTGSGPGAAAAGSDVLARLGPAAAGARRTMLLEFVREQVMDELGFHDQIDPGQPLNELGLDSLMSVNVANRLESALAVSVPVVKLIRGSSLDQLVDDLLPRLSGAGGGAPAMAADGAVARAEPEPPAPARTAPPDGAGWLVWPHPNPSARARLFCFPFAGAGAGTYRAWTESLHPSIELVAVEPPGRGARIHERAVDRLEPFLDALVPALRPYLDKPCAFFGHCLGGLTLFETARRVLQDRGERLEHLFVSGTRPPHRVAAQGPFEEALLAHLLAQPAFDPFVPAHEQPDDVFAEFMRRFNIGATDEMLNNAELRGLLLPSIRADFAIAYHYRFRPEPPWAVPITGFVGLDDPYVTREDALEWSRYSNVAFRLLMREGAHFLVVEDRRFIVDTINRELTS